jgi:hypothetical protein
MELQAPVMLRELRSIGGGGSVLRGFSCLDCCSSCP